MREAHIIVPLRDNDGIMLHDLHNTVQDVLTNEWGGWTSTICRGGWLAPNGDKINENVVKYTTAMEDNLTNLMLLDTLAHVILVDGRQQRVYYVGPDREVHFHTAIEAEVVNLTAAEVA